MEKVLLVIHLMITIALVGLIMMQRSEGGALGIGGGGGGFMTARGAANLLTRMTAILAAGFFATSISLALLAGHQSKSGAGAGSPTEQSGKAPVGNGKGATAPLTPTPMPAPAPTPSGPQIPQSK